MKFQSFLFSGVVTLGVQLPADAHNEKLEGATMSVMGTSQPAPAPDMELVTLATNTPWSEVSIGCVGRT